MSSNSRKRFTTEDIVNRLRQADVLIAQGQTIAQVCKQIGVIDQTYYRWRKEYGGLESDRAKRLKGLELKNNRLNALGVHDCSGHRDFLKRRLEVLF